MNNLKKNFTLAFYEQILSKIPYSLGVRMREKFLKKRIGHYGKGVRVSHNVKILGFENIYLNDYVGVANNCNIDGRAGIEIGKYSMVGFQSTLISYSHKYNNPNILYMFQGMEGEKITIGKNVWIGARVMILPGVSIGDNCIIGSNSIVTKSFSDNLIIAGNPAKIIKEIEN